MKIRFATIAAVALCSYATACSDKDTGPAEVWPRTTQARLTATKDWRACPATIPDGRVVPISQCAAPLPVPQPCDPEIRDHNTAARVLATQPHCIDHAITALERFARTDANAMVDLAAAYYMRAQRDDRATDLLHAWEASEQALAAAPNSLPQRFNRALIQESAGLYDAAITSWRTYIAMDPDSAWTGEAEQHLTKLMREQNRDAGALWGRVQANLPAALSAGDTARVAHLIERFPAHAYRYLETTLLPQFANAPTEAHRKSLQTFAEALSKRSGDPYARDLVNATEIDLAALKEGCAAFAKRDFPAAIEAFARAQSPVRHRMAIGAAHIVHSGRKADALTLLESPLSDVRDHRYIELHANIQTMRGHILTQQSDYFDALDAYGDALAKFTRLRDADGIARMRQRRSGVLLVLGRTNEAWREALLGMNDFARVVDSQERHTLLGATADAVASLGHPRLALLYRDNAVRLYQRELAAADPADVRRIERIQANLAVAWRARARTLVELNQFETAVRDLNEASRLAQRQSDRDIGRIIESRADEVRGQSLLPKDPNGAIAAFTRALTRTAASDYRTYRAALFAQRAAALRRAKRDDEAERDLRSALAELRAEEVRILERRRRGENDDVWTAYFSRFRETYEVLIRHLAEQKRVDEAFDIAERARAFEPLNLILQLQDVPESFRDATRGGTSADRAVIQQHLPAGTTLLEYLVLDDRTYTWILSRDRFDLVTQPVGRRKIADWQNALQVAVRDRDTRAFETILADAYAALVEKPLATARPITKRLVFVPDGPMHGLPLGALMDRETKRFLLEDYPISIAGSATLCLFAHEQDRRRTSDASRVLLIGDPAFDSQLLFARDMRRLRYARAEVEELHALYGSRAKLLIGADATVPAVISGAKDSVAVHVAAHGIVNAQAPSQSLLLLAPSAKHNGALDAAELLIHFKTDRTKLVVLAACSSAGGLPVGPEGVAPLVRPLIAAGVPAVIGSLWDVDDATAATLFVSFHRHYEQGEDAATALQRAQLELLGSKQAGHRSVFTWAPFQVIGHASSPFGPRHRDGGTRLGLRIENSFQRPDGLHAE